MSQTSKFSWTWLDKFVWFVSWQVRRLAYINLGVLNGGDFSHKSLKQRFSLLPCGNIPPPVIFSHVSSVGIYPSVVVSTNLSFHSCNYSTVRLLYPFDYTVCNWYCYIYTHIGLSWPSGYKQIKWANFKKNDALNASRQKWKNKMVTKDCLSLVFSRLLKVVQQKNL